MKKSRNQLIKKSFNHLIHRFIHQYFIINQTINQLNF